MRVKERLNLLREFSIPLLAGVAAALVWANVSPGTYAHVLQDPLFGPLSFHFLTNDVFMAFFFGIAAVEIFQSFLPGGDLHPVKKSINPLLATAGGVIGPALVYLALNQVVGSPALQRGWGIPTATDIAFAWLVARMIFGNGHPAIAFLLLLAVVDDGIGLAIIALFYPDPRSPLQPAWLLLIPAGMALSFLLRRRRVGSYWPYLLVGGSLSWAGLFEAHLHPALALVFVVPFLPHKPYEKKHLFEEDAADHSTIAQFEHDWKVIVDFGLFLFGLVNAGVVFSQAGAATWLVAAALLFGKSIGIFLLGNLAVRFGFPLPTGVGRRELLVIGIIGGFGFTVALFVSDVAFLDPVHQAAAKMGAMLSCSAALIAWIAGRALRIERKD